jgi:hypothetical protein
VPGGEARDQAGDRGLDRLGVGCRRLDTCLFEDGAVGVHDRTGDLGAADVDAAGEVARHRSSTGP